MGDSPLPPVQQKWFSGRPAGLRDLPLAVTLAVAYLVMTMATTWMGFTRDESFYFNYSKVYLNWFVELDRAETSEERAELLSKKEVERVWKQNFEHPPLMKVLFGVSWSLFGHKNRPLTWGQDDLVISELGLSHGFDKGDRVRLLGPVGLDEAEGSREVLGELEVTSRTTAMAHAQLVTAGLSEGDVAQLCLQAQEEMAKGSTPLWKRGCEAQTNETLQFLSESDAFRFPGALMGALLIAVLFLFGVEFGGRRLGALAVAFYAFMPHTFFHAHLTCFDVPIIAISMWVLYAFYRSFRSNVWAVVCGVLWGFGLLTKLNAFFLPITLVFWWLLTSFRQIRREQGLHLPKFPKAFLWMLILGFPMLFLLWPSLWYDSIQSLGRYMAFHLKHEHYYQYYFGTGYQAPPFPILFPFVFTLVSTPLVPLILALVGVCRVYLVDAGLWLAGIFKPAWRLGPVSRWGAAGVESDEAGWGRAWFVLIHMGFPMVLIALPSTPIFGGIKHWLQAYPFACLLAAQTVLWLLGKVSVLLRQPVTGWGGRAAQWAGSLALVGLLLAPGVRDTFKYVEYGTAYYNELIGGMRGAAEARMQRQFWSYASRGAMENLNRYAPMRSTVDFQDATAGTCEMLHLDGQLRGDLKCSTRGATRETLLFDVEERFSEEEIGYWSRMDTIGPAWEVTVDGVPMVRAYVRKAGYQWAEQRE